MLRRQSPLAGGNYVVIRLPKTCKRCLTAFAGVGRENICEPCRRRKQEPTAPVSDVRELSPRERQLVLLVRKGRTNGEIAAELLLTEGTIKEYLFFLFKKLQVRNRTQLAMLPDSGLTYVRPAA